MPKKIYQFFINGLRYDSLVLLHYLLSFITGTKPYVAKELDEDSLLKAIQNGKSYIRLGDGEAMLMTGRDIYFQPTSPALAKGLCTIYQEYSPTSPYLLGIPTNKLVMTDAKLRAEKIFRIWRLFRVYFNIHFPKNVTYVPLTYFYKNGLFEKKVAPLLVGRNIICVSNAKVLDEPLRTYMAKTFTTISFITTLDKNAFVEKNTITANIESTIAENPNQTPVVLLAAGPASKVIAYELSHQGIQCLDIGHGMNVIAHDYDRTDMM